MNINIETIGKFLDASGLGYSLFDDIPFSSICKSYDLYILCSSKEQSNRLDELISGYTDIHYTVGSDSFRDRVSYILNGNDIHNYIFIILFNTYTARLLTESNNYSIQLYSSCRKSELSICSRNLTVHDIVTSESRGLLSCRKVIYEILMNSSRYNEINVKKALYYCLQNILYLTLLSQGIFCMDTNQIMKHSAMIFPQINDDLIFYSSTDSILELVNAVLSIHNKLLIAIHECEVISN